MGKEAKGVPRLPNPASGDAFSKQEFRRGYFRAVRHCQGPGGVQQGCPKTAGALAAGFSPAGARLPKGSGCNGGGKNVRFHRRKDAAEDRQHTARARYLGHQGTATENLPEGVPV